MPGAIPMPPSTKKRHLVHQSHFVPGRAQFAPGCRSANRRRRGCNGFTMGRVDPGGRAPGGCRVGTFWSPTAGICLSLQAPPPAHGASGRQVSLEPTRRMQPGSQTQGRPPGGAGGPRLLQGKATPGLAPRLPARPGQSHSALSWSPRDSQSGLQIGRASCRERV